MIDLMYLYEDSVDIDLVCWLYRWETDSYQALLTVSMLS